MKMYRNYETGEFEPAEVHFDYRFEHSWLTYIPDFEDWVNDNMVDVDKAEEAHAIEFDFEQGMWHVNPEADMWDFVTEEA